MFGPPREANYVQRMGRTGRRTVMLELVLANARSHDLQFWENPNPMLKGGFCTGVYIAAEAFNSPDYGFHLRLHVAQSSIKGDFEKLVKLERREAGYTSGFPWIG